MIKILWISAILLDGGVNIVVYKVIEHSVDKSSRVAYRVNITKRI